MNFVWAANWHAQKANHFRGFVIFSPYYTSIIHAPLIILGLDFISWICIKSFQTILEVKIDINLVNLIPCQAHWVLKKLPQVAFKMSIFFVFWANACKGQLKKIDSTNLFAWQVFPSLDLTFQIHHMLQDLVLYHACTNDRHIGIWEVLAFWQIFSCCMLRLRI